jgi:hypothetical protein
MAKAVKSSKPGAKLRPKAKPADDYDAREDKYKIEEALRTLTKAEELRGDKSMMDKVALHAEDQANIANRAKMLVSRGLVSEGAAAKMGVEIAGATPAAEKVNAAT